MGDIDLRKEIRLHEGSGVVYRQSVRQSLRRIYSARINGRKADMTVAVYQGNHAEKVCLNSLEFRQFPSYCFALAMAAGYYRIRFLPVSSDHVLESWSIS